MTTTYIEDELKTSYLDYAMSVIVGRALPDARDGLKPVHRRILFAMHDAGWRHDKAFVKSAKVVGEVIGNYHPHGDAAAYETMVRLAQEWAMRAPLVQGQGNFGSIDGDSAAAYRYTEARLARVSSEMLGDIEKETVDFAPNFDGTRKEPLVLPARLPNLLVNGSSGIAVGMATNCPPHALSEVVDALLLYLDNPDVTVEELIEKIPGPDFPTGGIIYGRAGIRDAYRTGKGHLTLGSLIQDETVNGRKALVVTEIPYQVSKAAIVEEIAACVQEKRLEGIHDLRDESDRDGIRIVIELKRDADPGIVRNLIEKETNLVVTFAVSFLALVENSPKTLPLRDILAIWTDHRREVIRRRSTFLLARAEAEAHIKEGLLQAIASIDEVIALIRKSKNREDAHVALMKKFGFSAEQTKAILDLRLHRLTSLERIEEEKALAALLAEIERLQFILAHQKEIDKLIREDLAELKKTYGDARRTTIQDAEYGEFEAEDLIQKEDAVVQITHAGYVKRLPLSAFRAQKRGGVGVTGQTTGETDFVEHIFTATTHDYCLFFTTTGKCHWLKVHAIPETGRAAKGKAIVNLLQLAPNERIAAFVAVEKFDDRFVFFATEKGTVKKTPLADFSHPRAGGIHAIALEAGDSLIAARLTTGKDEVLLATAEGMAIRFAEEEARSMGRTAAGVRGIRLEEKDSVVGMVIVREGADLLTITTNGYGKRTALPSYPAQGRGGKGVIDIKTTDRNGPAVAARDVTEGDDLILASSRGIVLRTHAKDVSEIGRNTQGVRVMRLEPGDTVADVTVLAEKKEA